MPAQRERAGSGEAHGRVGAAVLDRQAACARLRDRASSAQRLDRDGIVSSCLNALNSLSATNQ